MGVIFLPPSHFVVSFLARAYRAVSAARGAEPSPQQKTSSNSSSSSSSFEGCTIIDSVRKGGKSGFLAVFALCYVVVAAVHVCSGGGGGGGGDVVFVVIVAKKVCKYR